MIECNEEPWWGDKAMEHETQVMSEKEWNYGMRKNIGLGFG
jgi:hypothetical protein